MSIIGLVDNTTGANHPYNENNHVFVDGEMIEVVYMTGAEATAAGWTFSESSGELTITDVPTLSSPTHVRIPDFVDGLPVRHIGDSGLGELFRKDGTVTNITGITSLTLTTSGNRTFYGCTSLESVSLPSLAATGDYTFYGCTSLVSAYLPSLTTAGRGAFYGCTSLESVNLPALTTAGSSTFYDCTSLESLHLPSLTAAGEETFGSCSSLVSVSLPALTTALNSTFRNCSSLESVFLGAHFNPSSTTNFFYTDASQDIIIYYPPGDEGYGAFWPNGSATEIGDDARIAVPDIQRWNGVINDGEVLVRNGNDYESGTPWI